MFITPSMGWGGVGWGTPPADIVGWTSSTSPDIGFRTIGIGFESVMLIVWSLWKSPSLISPLLTGVKGPPITLFSCLNVPGQFVGALAGVELAFKLYRQG